MCDETKIPRPRRGLAVGVAAAAYEIAEALRLRLPGDALERLVRSDARLRRMLRGMRRSSDGRVGLDTYERDELFDAVARYVGSSHWPTGMDGQEESDRFVRNVVSAIREGRLVDAEAARPAGGHGAVPGPTGGPPARAGHGTPGKAQRGSARLANGVEAARHDVARATGAEFPGDGLMRLVAGDRGLARRLRGYGLPPAGCDPGLDTADREHLFDAVARHLGATHWPAMHEGAEACTAMAVRVREAVADGRLAASHLVRHPDDGTELTSTA